MIFGMKLPLANRTGCAWNWTISLGIISGRRPPPVTGLKREARLGIPSPADSEGGRVQTGRLQPQADEQRGRAEQPPKDTYRGKGTASIRYPGGDQEVVLIPERPWPGHLLKSHLILN